ncbi:hypothetical protein K7957_08130 [Sphingomonas yunnanensis]|uniref:hypothetical protein n=1 Tax=Sphingomonas yunnanensis TaxID=310400 RepID=UPI001CA6F0FE|nr:hypothetical protein [Sphingomonas yunnanensis]MBY9062896.1 hypothetical protein [Sphingomonas yunnanensis]
MTLRRHPAAPVLAGWLLTSLLLVAASWDAIRARLFLDADDAMRLLEVRDWLGGQGWFDVAQHRLHRGDFPMHWSRLVDLPLAGAMLALRPLLGAGGAERVALVLVPLLTLLAVTALAALLARRLAGRARVPYAVLLVALASPLLSQLRPLRIDHHGWQVAAALAAAAALLAPPTRRSGALAGAALAVLLTISLEGLPIAAATAAIAALGWAWRPARAAMVVTLGWTLAGAASALHLATRGPLWAQPACDAIAPAWLAVLWVVAIGLTVAVGLGRVSGGGTVTSHLPSSRTWSGIHRAASSSAKEYAGGWAPEQVRGDGEIRGEGEPTPLPSRAPAHAGAQSRHAHRSPSWVPAFAGTPTQLALRLVLLALAGAAAAATWLLLAPDCLAGPFATLPPIVYRWWYLSVLEGRPLWDQPPALAAAAIGLPLAGLAGTALALRRLPPRALTEAARERWWLYLLLLLAATAIAIWVSRAAATANALAVPGAAVLLATLLARARGLAAPLPRTLATLGALLLASPGQVAAAALLLVPGPVERARDEARRPSCAAATDVRALAALPPGIVFAPLDVTPELLVSTRHRAIAGGYHRGARAMEQVLLGYTLPPARARAIVAASGADYLIACPGLTELAQYRAAAPDGLWARLERGERVTWLVPIAVRGPVLAWRVARDPLPAGPARP